MGTKPFPTYGGSSGNSTPTSTPSSTSAGTDGSFPQTPTTAPAQAKTSKVPPGWQDVATLIGTQNAIALSQMSPSTFFGDNQIDSTDQPAYTNTNGSLSPNAGYLLWYTSLSQSDRQAVQSQMAAAGLISDAEATGLATSGALTAFKSLIGSTSLQGSNPVSWLSENANGTSAIQNTISANLTRAQENATQPIVATVENPTTLDADLTSAFENALGYSPNQQQYDAFVAGIQAQDTSYAEAPRTEAQQQITQAKAETDALDKLGPDGIDTVIQAYQAAVNGTKMPGAGTVQGPANGAVPIPGLNDDVAPGTQQKPGDTTYYGAGGTQVGANVLPGTRQVTGHANEGALGQLVDNLSKGPFGANLNESQNPPQVKTTRTKYTPRGGGPVPNAPAGAPSTTPTYGGLFALSAKDWTEAQSLYSAAKKYGTPGAAPQSVQQGAFTQLLTNAYDNNGGSWAKAISSIASGSPLGTSEGSHLSAFGTSVANEVNNQISALQNQVNNDVVTTKVSQPDATAEADLAAKQSDPTSYYAAEDASWGEELNKMLSGTTSMYNQSSSDTFTGPVQSEAGSSAQASAPTTVGAGAI